MFSKDACWHSCRGQFLRCRSSWPYEIMRPLSQLLVFVIILFWRSYEPVQCHISFFFFLIISLLIYCRSPLLCCIAYYLWKLKWRVAVSFLKSFRCALIFNMYRINCVMWHLLGVRLRCGMIFMFLVSMGTKRFDILSLCFQWLQWPRDWPITLLRTGQPQTCFWCIWTWGSMRMLSSC